MDENPIHDWQYSKTKIFSNLILEQDLVWTHSLSGSSTRIVTSDKFGDRICTDLVRLATLNLLQFASHFIGMR